ncbi:MAG: SDR family NAD(P)-dependent oxidoreductase, partial [bacterium]
KEFKLRKIFSFVCDATDEASVSGFINDVAALENGNIGYLINTVGGIDPPKSIIDLSSDELKKMIDLNFMSTFYFTRETLKVMAKNKYGRIISIGAIAGLEITPQKFAYSFSKAGVINLMDTISEEMKELNIRCNTIIPSIIDTPANREWGSSEEIKKWIRPEEVSEIIYNFISEEFSSLRNTHLKVYGAY